MADEEPDRRYMVRVPNRLGQLIDEAARVNDRTLTAEIRARLRRDLNRYPPGSEMPTPEGSEMPAPEPGKTES